MSGEANKSADIFSTLEIDTIGEILNISMGSAATAASTLLDNRVSITTPVVHVIPMDEFDITPLEPAVAVEIKYVEGIEGSNILILRQRDVRTILEQMMQTEMPEDFVVDEMAESAMCELMNQMMGSSATVLSCFLGRTINISTPVIMPIEGLDKFKEDYFAQKENIVTIKFKITINDVMESDFISVMDIDLAKEIIDVSLNFDADAQSTEEVAPVKNPLPAAAPIPQAAPAAAAPAPAPIMPPAPAPEAMPQAAPSPYAAAPYGAVPPQPYAAPAQAAYNPYAAPQPGYGAPMPVPENPIAVKDYEFSDFGGGNGVQEMPTNMDLVMNVPVMVTVELGRTKRKIKEILEFGQGTIVELDKQAGSQVDVIVNGQMIARGDVVVVDDNFSIRITEILKSRDSLTML